MEKITTKFIARTAMLAALYTAITLAIAPIAYGAIQFRISEILVLLVFFDKKHFWGLTLGCFIANCFSPLGVYDIVFGTIATAVSLAGIIFIRNKLGDNIKALLIASLSPVVFNGLIVGIELTVLFKELPFILNAAYVAVGELVTVSILGVVIMNKIGRRLSEM